MTKMVSVVLPIILSLSFLAYSADKCELTIARLHYGGGGDWYNGPSSLPNLVLAVKKETTVPVCDTVAVVQIMDPSFFHYPFLYMTGHGNVHFSPEERIRLRSFLIGGGFLLANDDYGMDKSFRSEMKALFPENTLIEVPLSHPIYSSIHRLAGLPKIHEHDGAPAKGLGIFFDNRLVVFYAFSSDIGDGMEDIGVYPDPPALHRAALDMGVNIVAWFFSP